MSNQLDTRRAAISERSAWRIGAAVIAPLVLAVSLGGCSSIFGDDSAAAPGNEPPAEDLYASAETALKGGSEREAARLFDEVERLYPTSQLAKRSILMSAESSYKYGDYDKAALAARRFLDFYPSDEQAPYAQYIIAMSYYDQITDVGRDQVLTRAALQSLRELVNRYPGSGYAREAELKLELTYDHLAGKEMSIGRYYQKRSNYVGAINRFRTVVEEYQTTSHVAEALHRLVECYLALGVAREAQTAAAVLGHNFPGSEWYQDSYALLTGRDLRPAADRGSWMYQVWGGVTDIEWF